MATYALIHGAGSEGWYWHRVVPLLEARGDTVVAPDLPCDDDSAGLAEYADAVVAALDGADSGHPLVLVAQSLAGFTAPPPPPPPVTIRTGAPRVSLSGKCDFGA